MKKFGTIIGRIPEKFTDRKTAPKLPLIAIALIAGCIGTYTLIRSFAATPSTLYVASNGSDSGSCTQGAPCATFNRAYQVASLGDTVEVAAGTYGSQTINEQSAKELDGNQPDVTFKPASGASVTVSSISSHASHITLQDMRLTTDLNFGNYDPIHAGLKLTDITIKNLDGRNFNLYSATDVNMIGGDWGPASDCGGPYGGSNNSIRRAYDGINHGTNPNDIVIDGVTIHDIQTYEKVQCHMEGLAIFAGTNITIKNSKFYGNSIYDIFLQPNSGPISNITMENNWFAMTTGQAYGSGGSSTVAFSGSSGDYANTTLRHNSFNGNVSFDDNGVNPSYSNFKVIGNIGTGPWNLCSLNIAGGYSYNVWSGAACNSTERGLNGAAFPYVNASNDSSMDYHLKPGSVAVDLVPTSASGVAIDFDCGARPVGSANDAGADEYTSTGVCVGGTTSPPPADTTAPTVSVTAPANSATVSGTATTISATATDDTAVTGVQFKLDGANLGSEDTSSPYSTTWNTTTASNGTHTLTAVARDAAGNTKTSSSVTVTVSNSSSSSPNCVAGATNATTAAQVLSNVQANRNVCVTANVGDVDFNNIGAHDVTISTADGASMGALLIKDTTDITISNARFRSVEMRFADRTIVEDSTIGGTSTNRVMDQLIFMPERSDDVIIRNNDIGWTTADNTGNTGYGCRCYGQTNNLKFTGNKLHDLAGDGFQGTQGSNVLIDRNEIGPIGANPGSNEHSDNIQMNGTGPNLKITNNWIHHQGYFAGNVTGNSGSIYMHGGSTNAVLIENNLIEINQGRTEICGLGTGGTSISNITIRNNSWIDGGKTFSSFPGFEWDCDSGSGNTVANNIAVDPDGGFAQDGSTGAATFTNNLWGQASLVTFDASGNCISANCNPSGQPAIGYRCPTGVAWCTPGTTPPPSDTTNPTISFSSPTNGSTVSGTVTATAAASDNVGVTKVELSLDGSLKMTDTASPYNYSFDSKTLTNGSHTLSAKAYDAAGNTATTTITVTVSNPDVTPPTAPTNLNATAPTSTTVNLTWTASTDTGLNATGVVKYNVLRNGVVIAQPTTTSYTDTGRTANTSYTYVIQAVDGADNISANSASDSVTTPPPPTVPDTTAPSVPGNVTATAASSTQVNVSWNASTDTGGSGLAGYNVYRNGTKLNSSLVSSTTYGDSTTVADTTYSYRIEAVDGSNNKSAQSTAVSIKTPAIVRGDITGSAGVPDGKINLFDLSYVIRNYNTTNANGDISGPNGTPDGKVDLYDISYVIRNYSP